MSSNSKGWENILIYLITLEGLFSAVSKPILPLNTHFSGCFWDLQYLRIFGHQLSHIHFFFFSIFSQYIFSQNFKWYFLNIVHCRIDYILISWFLNTFFQMLEVSAAERCPKPCTDLAQRGEETVRRRLHVEDLITERGSSQSVATEAVV